MLPSVTKIYLSAQDQCMLVTSECAKDAINLVSNHEQAGTKVIFVAKHALVESRNDILKISSGDTYFVVLVVALLSEDSQRIFLNDETSAERFMTLHLLCRLAVGLATPPRKNSALQKPLQKI